MATINFPEKQKHFQPNQPRRNVRPQGLQSGQQAHGTPICPHPGFLTGLQRLDVDGCGSQRRAALLEARKSYREPQSCQKLFPGDFDQLML